MADNSSSIDSGSGAVAPPLTQGHTAGPWVVTTCLDLWVEPANAPQDDGFYGIALCGDLSWPGSASKQREWEANARLIAAAPDLLAELKAIVSYGYPTETWKRRAEAAIAQAEGRALAEGAP